MSLPEAQHSFQIFGKLFTVSQPVCYAVGNTEKPFKGELEMKHPMPFTRLFTLISIIMLTGCGRQSATQVITPATQHQTVTMTGTPSAKQATNQQHTPENSLNFDVENKTSKTIFTTCFSYIKKDLSTRWRWDKSPIQKIDVNKKATMLIDAVPDESDRKEVYGILAVFDSAEEAEDATYELLDDNSKLDLDLLCQLKDKTVTIEVEKYGFKKEKFDYEFKKKSDSNHALSPLDFAVENQSGSPLYVVCFIYHPKEKKGQFDPWHYEKGAVVMLNPQETKMIPVPPVYDNYNRIYMQGILAIFEADEEKLAQDCTYELLDNDRKLKLGRLTDLDNKKVTVGIERYGVVGDFIDYTIKPIQHPRLGSRKTPQ